MTQSRGSWHRRRTDRRNCGIWSRGWFVSTKKTTGCADDSIAEKPYTDENDLIAWYWDTKNDRPIKGIITVFYQTPRIALPVAYELVTKTETYLDAKTGTMKRRSPDSKNIRLRRMLHICCHNQLRFHTVLADAWFASADNMKFIRYDLGKEFVFAIKDNRKVALSPEAKKAGRATQIRNVEFSESGTRQVWLQELDFPVLLVQQVFTNEDGSTGTRYLAASDLTLSFDRVTMLFKRRWSIEVFHKSLKQNAALEKSPTRTETTQRNHFFASLSAYVKLERLKLSDGMSRFTRKSKIYLAAVKEAFREVVKLKEQLSSA